jgi:hypothetical protein
MNAMLINRGKTVALWLLGSGLTAAGAIAWAAGGSGTQDKDTLLKRQPARAAVDEAKPTAPGDDFDSPDALRKAIERRLEAARRRLDAQRAYYEEGRITVDRFSDALKQVMLAEMAQSATKANRLASAKAHLDRMTDLLEAERRELEIGRGTIADVAEAEVGREDAAVFYLQIRQSQGPEEVSVLKTRIDTLEKQLEEMAKRLDQFERSRNRY